MSQPTLPNSPRPITAAARGQSWRELPVRVWSLVTLGVLVVIFAVGVRAILQNNADRRLLREGVRVDATIDLIAGASRNVDRSVARLIDLSFQMPGEPERRELSRVTLPPAAGGVPINKGDTLPILIDPKNPRVWTDRVVPEPWLVVLATPLLLLPLAIALAAVTAGARARIIRLYAAGALRQASVVEAHRSGLVPGQKLVKFSLGDGRVLSAAYPDRLGAVAAGQSIDVIVNDEAKPTRAIVADAYSEVDKPR